MLNYRPISILTVVSLITKKFVFMIMTTFCEKYPFLCSSQCGFCQSKGTQSLVEDLSDRIHENIDSNKLVLTLFLNLKKAFDTIDHGLLVHKLEQLRFRGPFIEFLADYLSGRQQLVKIGDAKSKLVTVRYGVSQGSNLGPLFFNIYVNEIGRLLFSSRLFQCADDTALVSSGNDEFEATLSFHSDISRLMA